MDEQKLPKPERLKEIEDWLQSLREECLTISAELSPLQWVCDCLDDMAKRALQLSDWAQRQRIACERKPHEKERTGGK